MMDTPKGLRRHIAIMGRRNAGKSTLMNALARQTVAIVSPQAGTTTDPVEKTMEIAPMGPVVLIDTAGIDDEGEIGRQRIERSRSIQARSDIAVLVTDGEIWEDPEQELARSLIGQKVPFVVARNKMERNGSALEKWRRETGLPEDITIVDISARENIGLERLVKALAGLDVEESGAKPLLADLLPPGGLVLLIVPLDTGAPKGRLILPQVQAIRDCLDGGRICMVSTEKEGPGAIARLKPDLVVCDSQVAGAAARMTPKDVPFTTFSILMARNKGNLAEFAAGAAALEKLRPGDTVLIEEACSHHAQKDDIGRVKIPALLNKMCGGGLNIRHHQGKEPGAYGEDIKAVVHCGACVITRRQMLVRQAGAGRANIPMTNYGMAMTLGQGILERALEPFPEALTAWKQAQP